MNKLLLVLVIVLLAGCLAVALLVVLNMPARVGGIGGPNVTQVYEAAAQPTPTPYETLSPPPPTPTAWEPTHTPVAQPTAVSLVGTPPPQILSEDGGRFRYEGVGFAYDPALMIGAEGWVVPENLEATGGPFWEIHPEYINIHPIGYPQGLAAQVASVRVYPVEAYGALSDPAAAELDELRAFLAEKPADAASIPFLPLWNAGQTFHSNVKHLDFENGSGVRFLALYAQYPAPVTNAELFYTYQGLTADGRYAVSVILPVDHPELMPDPDAIEISELQAIADGYDAYRKEVRAALEADEGVFEPPLAALDAWVQTLRVEK